MCSVGDENTHNLSGLPPSFHSEDEAVAIEDAIRAAINTVMAVMCSACSRRVLEYQRMVADRDTEIRRLESSLEKSESELEMLRLQVGGRRRPETVPSNAWSISSGEAANSSCKDMKNEPEVKFCDVGAEIPKQVSSKSPEAMEAFPRQHAQTEKPSGDGGGAAGGQPSGCTSPQVKEEASNSETVIKWEVCEDQQEGRRGGKPADRGLTRKLKAKFTHKTRAQKYTQAECEAKTTNLQTDKLMATEHEEEGAAPLKRKGRERNRCHLPESEEEEAVVKRACVTQSSAPKITAPKYSLGVVSSPQTSNLNATQEQQTYVTMSPPQPTCDSILLEVLVSLETIKQQNTTVLQILQSGNSPGAPPGEPPDVGMLPLPLQSVQDLGSLEQRLSTEPELKKKMISYLGLSGGMTTKESVWRIMAKLFTNALAKNVNWRGRNNKQRIENLTIKRVILNAVRQNSFCKEAVDEEIERYMKRWLQLAGDRDGGRKRRQEKGKEANSMQDYCVGELFTRVIE